MTSLQSIEKTPEKMMMAAMAWFHATMSPFWSMSVELSIIFTSDFNSCLQKLSARGPNPAGINKNPTVKPYKTLAKCIFGTSTWSVSDISSIIIAPEYVFIYVSDVQHLCKRRGFFAGIHRSMRRFACICTVATQDTAPGCKETIAPKNGFCANSSHAANSLHTKIPGLQETPGHFVLCQAKSSKAGYSTLTPTTPDLPSTCKNTLNVFDGAWRIPLSMIPPLCTSTGHLAIPKNFISNNQPWNEDGSLNPQGVPLAVFDFDTY